MTPKRKQAEDTILKTVATIDRSGYNTTVYKQFFASLTDKQFDSWMESLRDNKNSKVTLLVPPFKVNLTIDACLNAAKSLGLEIMERLRLWDHVSQRYCLTPEKYFVLKLPVRRLKQYLMSGLSVPDSDRRLNPLTDQVVKPDKGSSISFPQSQMIAEKGLQTTLHELISIRGGDVEAYANMKAEIEETGSSDTGVMQGTKGVKSAQTLRTALQAMHLDTNL